MLLPGIPETVPEGLLRRGLFLSGNLHRHAITEVRSAAKPQQETPPAAKTTPDARLRDPEA